MVLGNGTLTNAVQVLRHVIDLGNTGEREMSRVELQTWRIIQPGIIRNLLNRLEQQRIFDSKYLEKVLELRVGKRFDFSRWFPGLPIIDGEFSTKPESEDRKRWLKHIWETSVEGDIISIGSMEDLFKVYLVICGFRMRCLRFDAITSTLFFYAQF